MRPQSPSSSPFDLAVASLVAGELAFSLLSAAAVLHLQFLSPAPHLPLNSLWPARLLLLLLSSLLSSLELLRLPSLCSALSLLSPSLAQPALLSLLLSLLRSSTTSSSPSLLSALSSSLPFLLLNLLFISTPSSLLLRLHLPRNFLGHHSFSDAHRRRPCPPPLFSTILLAALAAIYVPLFVTAVWNAVAVVINKRLRARLYALSAALVAALSVQVAARALAALWPPASAVSQALSLASFVAMLFALVAAQVVLVLLPVVDAILVVHADNKRRRSRAGNGCGVV